MKTETMTKKFFVRAAVMLVTMLTTTTAGAQGTETEGDANDDVRVNAADIVEMVNAKNDKASDRFVLKYADIDGDKKITQSDIDAVVKIIMQK